MKKLTLLFLTVLAVASNNAMAYLYLQDDFNDDILDPAWTVSLGTMTESATYEESNGSLIISDIDVSQTLTNIGSNIQFRRTLDYALVADFHADILFHWNEYNDPDARQMLIISFMSSTGEMVTDVRMSDPWHSVPGRKDAYIANQTYANNTGPQDLPFAGTADIDIDRIGSEITIKWNDETLLTGYSIGDISTVTIMAWHSEWAGLTGTQPPSFGDYSIDSISLSGSTPIPEPSTIMLTGTALIYFIKKKR